MTLLSNIWMLYINSAQGGQWAPAEEFSEKAINMERDELGSRPERMADLHFLQAKVLDEVTIQPSISTLQ